MQFSRRVLTLLLVGLLAFPVHAGTMPLLGVGGQGGGGAPSGPLTVEFTGSAVDATAQTVYTFTAQPLGTATADRQIVVGFSERASAIRTITSITVAGQACGIINQIFSGAGDINRTAMCIAAVPTGTTGDVVVTLSGAALRAGIGLWALKGSATTASSASGVSTTDPATSTLTIPVGGVAIGYGFAADGAVPRTATWTNLTENFDQVITTNFTHTGASVTGAGSTLFTCDWSDAPSLGSGVVFATFGP
jgi:hypothetical protein